MKYKYLITVILSSALLGACASGPAKTSDPAATAKVAASVEGEIVGKPAPGSKFSKLKIGLTLKQASALIGTPSSEAKHPTGKVSIPFYFGPDRWVIKHSYKGEGLLTFNYGGEQLLTRIVVNKDE